MYLAEADAFDNVFVLEREHVLARDTVPDLTIKARRERDVKEGVKDARMIEKGTEKDKAGA